MAGRMEGKVAIVTGGNSGMGLATVEMFVAEGARVMIAARGEERGQAAADRLGENAAFVQTDVTSEDDIKEMIDATVDRWGQVDCLFSNAAAGCPAAKVEDFDTSDFQSRMMNILGSVFLGMKHVVPVMKKQGGGSIINNGSTAGVNVDGCGSAIYSAAKAGVIHATKLWALELAEFSIRVNCISPGAIVTPIMVGGYQRYEPAELERLLGRVESHFAEVLPLRRGGKPEDIAYAAVYLASDESLHTTGHNLVIESGNTLGRSQAEQDLRSARRRKAVFGSD
ncbi:MAG: SDR family oxidoreductase [Candidatus Poribacteria bacterium]|nr:SDR family oxidoreductase [Candidatus Poribacteria bacterium]